MSKKDHMVFEDREILKRHLMEGDEDDVRSASSLARPNAYDYVPSHLYLPGAK